MTKLRKYIIQAVSIFLFCMVLIIQVTSYEPEYTVLEKNDELVSLGNLGAEPFLKEYKTKTEQVAAMEAEAEQILIADSKEDNRMMSMNRVPAMPDHMEGVLIYDYFWDFHDDPELPFVSEKVFAKIKAAYDKIEYQGGFEKGDTASYDFYKEKYYLLVENEEPFYHKEREADYLLKNYNGNGINWHNYGEDYDVRNFDYYFFDMDGDGAPELGVVDQMNLKDIFKYEKEKDRFVLWYSMEQLWDQLVGSRKVMWYHYGNICIQSEFYQLDKEGDEECLTFFAYTPGSEYVYIVGLPDYVDDSKELEVTEDMKKQGIYERSNGHWYFRINEKQFQKLEERYLKAYKEAKEKLKEVTFTYEELFGGIS